MPPSISVDHQESQPLSLFFLLAIHEANLAASAILSPFPILRAATPPSPSLPGLPLPLRILRGWRSHECKVDADGLVEQLGVVGALDGGFGFALGGEFDERVALVGKSACCFDSVV